VNRTWKFASAVAIVALGGRIAPGTAPRLSAAEPAAAKTDTQSMRPGTDGKLLATVGKSLIIDSPLNIEKISVANGDLVEAVAINPKEVLINGKAAGETSLIVWQQGGARLVYDLTVRISPLRLEAVREQIAREFPDDDINVTYDNDTAFVRGTVKDLISAQRVMAIVTTLGRTVNLLRVKVPAEEPQIMLHVRFIDVDRSASQQLGLAIATAAGNQYTGASTGAAGGPGIDSTGTFSLSNALNVFLFRKDINLGAAIQALEAKNLAETLSEPNVLALNGQQASFLSGGQFPVPMVQGSSSLGTVTITYEEYGIRLTFLPVVTPRGTIQLQVNPEVSALDYANAVSLGGFTVPATSVRRIRTEVELEEGQSFVIAGLIDNSFTEGLSKIPGLANIPLLGKLFTSRTLSKSNSELMVIVTPEIVRPIPKGMALPDLNRPKPFLPTNTAGGVTQPGIDKTGALPVHPPQPSVPYEQLLVPAPRMGAAGSQSQTSGMPSGNAPAVGADGQPVQAPAPASAPPAASPVKQ
jgi:pilus assembly protein CpaC